MARSGRPDQPYITCLLNSGADRVEIAGTFVRVQVFFGVRQLAHDPDGIKAGTNSSFH